MKPLVSAALIAALSATLTACNSIGGAYFPLRSECPDNVGYSVFSPMTGSTCNSYGGGFAPPTPAPITRN